MLAALIAAPLILLCVPYIRRMIHGLFMAFCGSRDAKALATRNSSVALLAVINRLSVTKRRVEARIQLLIRRWNKKAGKYTTNYFFWRKEFSDATIALQHAHIIAEHERREAGLFGPPTARSSSARAGYVAFQTLITLLDVIMTYLSLEILLLAPVALLPMSIGVGALGAVLGHATGLSLRVAEQHLAERSKVFAAFVACALYCGVLGSMRFAYVLATGMKGIPPTVDAVIAFGFPIMLLTASVISGWIHKPLTPLERAILREAKAKRGFDKSYQRGERAALMLVNRMTEARDRGNGLIDAYLRGFYRVWTGDDLNLRDIYPAVPAMDLWPPVMPSATSLVAEEPDIDSMKRPAVTIGR